MCGQTARVHLYVDCVLFLWAFFKELATKAFIYSSKAFIYYCPFHQMN